MRLQEQLRAFVPFNAQERADRALMLRYLEEYDNLLTRENPLLHLTASAWVVSPQRDQLLMVYHNIYQSWSWTGGHADGEGDLLAVARREVMEETGLEALKSLSPEIFSLEILGVQAHEKRGCPVSAHLHLNVCFLFEADPTLPLRPAPGENSAVAWIPASQVVARSTEPAMQVVYRKLLDKMNHFRA